MRIGVPKEIKVQEHRVGLTPMAVREYAAHGHELIVQAGAGAGIGADDAAYIAAGARIVPSARVVVIGGGVVGTHAARMAVGLGSEVTVLDRSLPRLRQLDELFAGRVRTRFSSVATIEEEVLAADVVIGAVLIPGASAPKVITRAMLKKMRPRSVLVDVSIDQGGCFETSHATTHDAPTYEVDDIIHYCVANMPGAVPATSSHALNHATLPFGP